MPSKKEDFSGSLEVLVIINNTTDYLIRMEMGPGANPARRFAIWAFNHSNELTQREISRLLDVFISAGDAFVG